MTSWPPQRAVSASRKRAGTASRPLLSRFSCDTPRNTLLPVSRGHEAPACARRPLYPTCIHFLPLYWKGNGTVKGYGTIFFFYDKDLCHESQADFSLGNS